MEFIIKLPVDSKIQWVKLFLSLIMDLKAIHFSLPQIKCTQQNSLYINFKSDLKPHN